MKILLIGSTGFIGKIVRTNLFSPQIELYEPTSIELDLRDTLSIEHYLKIATFNGQKKFDFIIYCALDKDKKHFEDINLQNLKNLVAYQEYYHSWIHFSSRAIYDGLGSFMNIPVIAIEKLPKPTNPYSRLKYKEEIILQKQLSRSNHILRLFDVTISENYSDIKRRWSDQILHKQRCKNEVLSPIKSNIINMIIDKIITKQTPFGTYNLCGTKTISSKDIMGFHASGEQIFKTGKMSFDVN